MVGFRVSPSYPHLPPTSHPARSRFCARCARCHAPPGSPTPHGAGFQPPTPFSWQRTGCMLGRAPVLCHFWSQNRLRAGHGAGFAPSICHSWLKIGCMPSTVPALRQGHPPLRPTPSPNPRTEPVLRQGLLLPQLAVLPCPTFRKIIAPTNKRRCASVRHALLAVFPKSAGPESSDAVQAT